MLGLVTQFLISIYHHMAILLTPALQQFQEILKDFHNVEAGKRPFESGEAPTIRELLDYATGGIEGLNDSWGKAMLKLGLQEEEYTVSEGDKVPTASPRQLLICLLVNHPVIQEKLEVDGDTALGKSQLLFPFSWYCSLLLHNYFRVLIWLLRC
jgi:hypothetical protein